MLHVANCLKLSASLLVLPSYPPLHNSFILPPPPTTSSDHHIHRCNHTIDDGSRMRNFHIRFFGLMATGVFAGFKVRIIHTILERMLRFANSRFQGTHDSVESPRHEIFNGYKVAPLTIRGSIASDGVEMTFQGTIQVSKSIQCANLGFPGHITPSNTITRKSIRRSSALDLTFHGINSNLACEAGLNPLESDTTTL